MTDKRHVTAAETAKLILQALKESFPGVTFSVRADGYSMGATVRVLWDDGPTRMQVDAVARSFDGTYFDAMTDYAGSRYHLLDGEVVHFYPSVACNRGAGPLAEKWKLAWAQLSTGERVAYFKATGIATGTVAGDVEDPERCWWPAWHAFSHWEGDPKPSPTLARVKLYGDDGYGEGTMGTPEEPARAKGHQRLESAPEGEGERFTVHDVLMESLARGQLH